MQAGATARVNFLSMCEAELEPDIAETHAHMCAHMYTYMINQNTVSQVPFRALKINTIL